MSKHKRPSILYFFAIAAVAAIVVVGGRWYAYVAYARDPFDTVGISLNLKMPPFIRKAGCDMLKVRFEGKTLPPAGCGDTGSW